MPTIRDTIDPTRERDVSDEEALDLERMGILLTGTRAKTPEGLTAAAVRQVADRVEGIAPTASEPAVVRVGGDAETLGDGPAAGDQDDEASEDDAEG